MPSVRPLRLPLLLISPIGVPVFPLAAHDAISLVGSGRNVPSPLSAE